MEFEDDGPPSPQPPAQPAVNVGEEDLREEGEEGTLSWNAFSRDGQLRQLVRGLNIDPEDLYDCIEHSQLEREQQQHFHEREAAVGTPQRDERPDDERQPAGSPTRKETPLGREPKRSYIRIRRSFGTDDVCEYEKREAHSFDDHYYSTGKANGARAKEGNRRPSPAPRRCQSEEPSLYTHSETIRISPSGRELAWAPGSRLATGGSPTRRTTPTHLSSEDVTASERNDVEELQHRPLLRSKKRKKKKKGASVQFMRNEVKEVVVYEVDRTLYIDISYTRNRLGWLLLLLSVVIGTWWTTYALWVVHVKKPTGASATTVAFWTCTLKLICYALLVLILWLSGVVSMQKFTILFTKKKTVGLPALLFGVASTMATVMEVVGVTVGKTHALAFSPTVNLGILWLLLIRYFRKQPTFLVEWVGAAIACAGYLLASGTQFDVTSSEAHSVLAANGVMLAASLSFTVWVAMMEHGQGHSPNIVITYLPLGLTDVIFFFVVALVQVGPSNILSAGLFDMFSAGNFQFSLILGAGGLVLMLCYMATAMYLDIMSVLAAFCLKTIAEPYAAYFFIYRHWSAEKQHRMGVAYWNAFLWAGSPIVFVGCLVLIIFASVKRQFVARRLAIASESKHAGNPYLRAPPESSTSLT